MQAIYEPKGPALEYSELACNLYGNAEGKKSGCSHGCTYCFCPQYSHQKKEDFHCSPVPRIGILGKLEHDADLMARAGDDRRVLFSFFGDVYCPEEMKFEVTRQALDIMVQHGLRFTVLTKGGTRACRDFDLLTEGRGLLGVSMVWAGEFHREAQEPGAAPLADRIESLRLAHEAGIYTWMSVEPVFWTNEALACIKETLPYVDEYRIGTEKNAPYYYDEYWPDFIARAQDWIVAAGKKVMFKESLHKYLNGRPAKVGYEIVAGKNLKVGQLVSVDEDGMAWAIGEK